MKTSSLAGDIAILFSAHIVQSWASIMLSKMYNLNPVPEKDRVVNFQNNLGNI